MLSRSHVLVVEHNRTYVAKVRVRSSSRETMSLRLRLNQALTSLDLHPAGLPSSAVAIIRKLEDPAPGSLKLHDAAGVPVAWAQAVAASLDQIVRRAARPALERVSADADAVLFADRAELLACLAADWCDGTAITRWWWQTLFRATDVSSAVVREWLTSIDYVPAAFEKLAQRGIAITFACALPARAVNSLVDEITRHFGLTGLRDERSASINETQSRGAGGPRDEKGSSGEPSDPELFSSSLASELRIRWAPEAFAPRLEQNARVLLAVALMLERAPTLLRERGFAARLVQSVRALNASDAIARLNAGHQLKVSIVPATDLAEGNEIRLPLMTSPRGTDKTRAIEPPAVPETHQSDYRVQQDGPDASLEEANESEHARVLARDLRAVAERSHRESISTPVQSGSVTAEHRGPEPPQATPNPEADVTSKSITVAVETNLGGIFYLINAALALNLYGDFTTPLEPGIELSIWDFLALTGREIAGKRIQSDPVWPLLARLACRDDDERPGAHFKAPDEWRIPPRWLNAFPERDEWSYRVRRGRLVVRHPAGFDVLEVKPGSGFQAEDVGARLASETRCYANIGFKRRRFVSRGIRLRKRERGLDRWTRWMADYLRARLERALGIRSADELTAMLFTRAARVEVTPARLDAFFSLAELPVEIRLAGLDRDPGWVPAAGRAIAFHYE